MIFVKKFIHDAVPPIPHIRDGGEGTVMGAENILDELSSNSALVFCFHFRHDLITLGMVSSISSYSRPAIG